MNYFKVVNTESRHRVETGPDVNMKLELKHGAALFHCSVTGAASTPSDEPEETSSDICRCGFKQNGQVKVRTKTSVTSVMGIE